MNQKVRKILLETNQFCNLSCEYCFYNDIGRSKNYLTCENIRKICNKYPNANDFMLTGGECTINSDFYNIVEYLSSQGKVTVFTNGLSFKEKTTKEIVSLLSMIDKLIVTYDSVNPLYMLRKGKETCVLDTVKKILAFAPEKLEIKICLSKLNIDDFEETLKTLINNGVQHFSINYIKNISTNTTDFELSQKELDLSFDIINRHLEYFKKDDMEFFQQSYRSDFKNKVKCISGQEFIYIDCNKEEFYCPSSGKKLDCNCDNNCFGKHCISIWELFR